MKTIVFFLYFILGSFTFCNAQNETAKWVVPPNSLIDFSVNPPVLSTSTTSNNFFEANASISDKNGNLLFYTDGDTVKGANNVQLNNGSNLCSVTGGLIQSTTQGALFVKQPKSDSIYYLFSLSTTGGNLSTNATLSYSIIDKSLNSGIGEVISKNNELVRGTLAEKMTATKHCNNNDVWLVVIKYNILNYIGDGVPSEYEIEFQSYLVSKFGLQSTPIKSRIKTNCPVFGQMKFNNRGNELAFAGSDYLSRFNFDNTTGKVSLKEVHYLPLESGYGLEYSPNDSLIYINEKQFDIYSNQLVSLAGYTSISQLQSANNGKIHFYSIPKEEIYIYTSNDWSEINGFLFTPNVDFISNIGAINSPNISGIGCLYSTNAFSMLHPGNDKNYFALPNIPNYNFNNKISNFIYNGTCENEVFEFTLENIISADSVIWSFDDFDTEIIADTAYFSFPTSGDWQVSVEVYVNGVVYQNTQCVNVCGSNSIDLPNFIDLCQEGSQIVDALTPCTYRYDWNTGDTTSSLFIKEVGTYILTSTNECGVFYDTIDVFKSEECNVVYEIPNVITSNGDFINDNFTITIKNAKTIDFSIVNRWGNLIISDDIDILPQNYYTLSSVNIWDGKTQKGNMVSPGTYFYIFKFTTLSGELIKVNGFIQVIY